MSRPFTLNQLRYFQAVAQAQSMTTAAGRLNVTQSAVSTAMAELERSLGVDLFIRKRNRSVVLSPMGRLLWSQIDIFLEHADALYEAAQNGQEGEVSGVLRVAIFSPIAPFRAPAILAAYEHRYPKVRVEVREGDLAEIQELLLSGECGIIHARTASPEFSCATFTHSPLWGVTRNPWNLDRTPGGSSGGAGAALAAGYTPLATASDIAGSTRIPAGFTGTVGYKAPYGRIPGVPPLSLDWYRGDGPMARTVADTALLTAIMAGVHPSDHTSLPNPLDVDGWLAAAAPLDPAGVRIGLSITLGDYPVDPAVAAATTAVARTLAAAGAEIVEVDLPWTTDRIRETTFTHFGHLLAPAMREATAGHEGELAAYTRRFIEDALATAARRSFYDGLALEAQLHGELATAMSGLDALLCPVSAVGSLLADDDYLYGIEVGGRRLIHYWETHMTSPFNVANRCPVLAVPSGMTVDDVPVGVQIVGHPYDDATVFGIGGAIEQLRPWPRLAG